MTLERDLDFTGRRVLVTGAANGIGAATARLFARHGATVILADIEAEPLAVVAAELGAASHVYDQSDMSSIDRLAADTGPVDILLNIAGALVAKPFLETTPEEMRRLVDIDFLGAARLMQLFGAHMVNQQSGVILSIGSQTAFTGGEGRAVYAASKAAIAQLTRSAAVEWGPSGVRVLSLAPGRTITRMTEVTANPGYKGDRGLARVPLGRWGTAEEMAKLIVFLCSDAGSYITGETLIADGGYVLG